LREFTQHLSAGLFAEDNVSKANIDESLAKGTLGRYGRCRLSAAIQVVATEISQKLSSEILQKVENTLENDEAARKKAREEAEEEARKRAKAIAQETAKATAEEVARLVAERLAPDVAKNIAIEIATRLAPEAAKQPAIDTATKIAREVAIQLAPEAARQPAVDTATRIATEIANEKTSAVVEALEASQDMQDFERTNMVGFEHLRNETQQVIREASKRAPVVVQRFGIPKELTYKVPRLALYDFLVLCDNSGSMTSEASRIPTLKTTLRALFNVREELRSKRQFSIFPFLGKDHTNVQSAGEVEATLASFRWNGGDAIQPFRERILKRLEDDANARRLYPTVTVIITDGKISSVSKLGNAIATLKQTLNLNGYFGPATLFLICRVGSSSSAAESLGSLKDNPDIKNMVFLSDDQLDTKLINMQDDVDQYAGWVVGELLKAMDLQAFPT
jgi:hypothetical protein